MKIASLFLFLLSCVMTQTVGATSFYVDNAATGANNGLSWSSAWNSFSSINWASVSAGDSIFISGGTISKTYYETLSIGKSGTAGSPITIEKGRTTGHSGKVIIDAQDIRQNAVYVSNRHDVVVRGLDLINAIGSGAIRISTSSNVTAENLYIFVHGHGGVYVRESSNCIVRNNIIRTPDYDFNVQTDGIYAQLNTGNIYEYNNVVISNQNADQHCDGIQMHQETDAIVRNNYFEQDNFKTGNAQGIYGTECAGSILIYNNVVYCPNTLANIIGCRNLTVGTAEYRILNNTVIGKSGNMIRVSGSNPVVKNNIIYKTGSSYAMVFEDTVNDFRNIDFNIVYISGGGDVVHYYPDSEGKTWSEWRAMGAERNGMVVDPKVNLDGTLQGVSAAIDRGADLSVLFTYDKPGNARLPGQWDIGAYEYGSTSPPNQVQAPTKLRIK